MKTIAEIIVDFSKVKNLRQIQTDDVSNSYVAAMCQGFEDWGRTGLEKILGDIHAKHVDKSAMGQMNL